MIFGEDRLFSALFAENRPRCVAFVGGGGKTTSIAAVRGELLAQGSRVVVTTTTKTLPPEEPSLLAADAREAGEILKRGPYCIAGEASSNGYKMSGLPDSERRALLDFADFVLVEADGSHGQPLKFTRHFEPVIPQEAEAIVVMVGLDGVGKTLREAVHCHELACDFLGKSPDDIVDAAAAAAIIRQCYVKRAAREHPGALFAVLLNKYDDGRRKSEAGALAAELSELRVVVR